MTKLVISTSGTLVTKRVTLRSLMAYHEGDMRLSQVLALFTQWEEYRKSMMSAEDADNNYPSMLKKLSKFLDGEGWDNKVVELRGFKVKPGKTACDTVQEKFRKKGCLGIDHAVVKVGQLTLDPCKMRMGEDYDLPWNYQESRLHEYWNSQHDVTHLVHMSPTDVAFLVKNQKSAQPHAMSSTRKAVRVKLRRKMK